MTSVERFRCFLIGAESLLVECGETLLKQGHEIVGVITATKKVADWARSKNLRVVDAAGDYGAVLREQPFDYFFSITHLAMVPDELLTLPTKGSINFHDGPLPRYAGLNTPVWGILRGETNYAVTWHYMTDGIDTGDVLVQKPVDIAADDTALTLNTKCFHAGIESFAELVGLLATGGVTPRPQDFSERMVFSKFDRPAAAGFLDWTKTAVELAALVRAVDHGRYRNPVGTAKVRYHGRTHLVAQAVAVDETTLAEPGTIVEITSSGIRVACCAGMLELQGFMLSCGKPVVAEMFAALHGLAVGAHFEQLGDDDAATLTTLNAKLARGEEFWVRRLKTLDAATVPYVVPTSRSNDVATTYVEARQIVPHDFLQRFADVGVGGAIACAWAAYLARVGEKTTFDVAFTEDGLKEQLAGPTDWAAQRVPLRFDIDATLTLAETVERHAKEFAAVRKRATYSHDVVGRFPELHDRTDLTTGRALPILLDLCADVNSFSPVPGPTLQLAVSTDKGVIRWVYDEGSISSSAFATLRQQFAQYLAGLAALPKSPLADVEFLSSMEKKLILRDWNATAVDYRRDVCVHQLFEEQAARTPDAVAVVFEDRQLTYRQLNERSSRLAARLRSLGIGPDKMVGIHLERSENLIVAVMATLKAGGAYLPLDPNYPDDRIAFMIDDAQAPVIITERETFARLPANAAAIVHIDNDLLSLPNAGGPTSPSGVASHNLAYVIYTSGSTGKPKGVMIEHRNAVNFFVGMDAKLDCHKPGTWMAVTSLSFDIHVLELLWTLARGFKVVVYRDRERDAANSTTPIESHASTSLAISRDPAISRNTAPIDFSLFYFSADSEAEGRDKYRLLLEGSRWADEHGFIAVWTPERHFHSFGGLYPNPAVTGAAVAAITKNVQIRAGSIVLPLHHPARVAEAWQVVDNLSNGRVGLSVAAGWQPNDFVLMPENFKDAKNVMFRDTEIVKRLWRGEAVEFPGATGKTVAVQTLPRPIQKELPIWVTTAGNLDTYVRAGQIGANVLTHLLGQSVEDLAPKIAAYREARAAAGFDPATGIVSLMLHTFVGSDAEKVRETVRGPLKAYLGTSLNLLKQYAWAFPAFTRPKDVSGDQGNDFETLTPEEQDALLDFAFERYYETSGLFGTHDNALAMVDKLKAIGVGEIACLIDFGVPTDAVLASLPYLNEIRISASTSSPSPLPKAVGSNGGVGRPAPSAEDGNYSLAAQMQRHAVTHFQCTPSLARILLSDDAGRTAARNVKNFLVGGEAFPVDLAKDLHELVGGKVINMYGPTETTVWSTSHTLDAVDGPIPIGRPLANQQVYVLDKQRRPVPVGVPGELYIAGDGVTRGYLHRAELTAERFVADPFSVKPEARMYRTGDLVRFAANGIVEFLGRTDHQVKIRGHRIELGEIETRLLDQGSITQCVVVPREVGPGDVRLVAYCVAAGTMPVDNDLRVHVRAKLPEYMVPSHFVALDALPLTPNGKIDRRALPAFDAAATAPATTYAAPENDLEQKIATLWQELLGREQVGVDDNFFDIGGHSLLVVRMHRQLTQTVDVPVALTDLFRFPTIRTLVAHLAGASSDEAAKEGTDRAKQRRELMQKRRGARSK